jgi:hypothetical protein
MQIAPSPDRFTLCLGPDGVYRVDGRVIPSADHPSHRIDHNELVVVVHGSADQGKGILGRVGRVHVEQ